MTRGRWGWAIGWAVLIEALILWPSPPQISSPFTFIGLDKVVHATLFGVQAVLLLRALGAPARRLWPAVAVVMAFGALTEIEQHFVPTRSMELGDFLADSAGAIIGFAIFAALAPRRRESHR